MKTIAFIDGANLSFSMRKLDWALDFSRIRSYLDDRFDLLRALYYSAEITEGHNPLRGFTLWLSSNGYQMVQKPAKFQHRNGVETIKGNMDIEIAVDMLELAPRVDQMLLFSGDGDFKRVLQSVQRLGVHVIVVGTVTTTAEELRLQADKFIEINEMRGVWERVGA